MGQITTSIEIPAEPQKVWEAITTPSTYEQWLTIHTKWKSEIPETFSQGATADEVVTMLGMPNTIKWTVEQFDAPTRLTISGTGMAGVRTTFGFAIESDGASGSKASINAEFTGQMITGALGKAVEKDAMANLEASLSKLSTLVS